MFLRGAGTNEDEAFADNIGPDLNTTQEDTFESHEIDATSSPNGSHGHELLVDTGGGGDDGFGYHMIKTSHSVQATADANGTAWTQNAGTHAHTITGESIGGAEETRPVNYGVNYIIKL